MNGTPFNNSVNLMVSMSIVEKYGQEHLEKMKLKKEYQYLEEK